MGSGLSFKATLLSSVVLAKHQVQQVVCLVHGGGGCDNHIYIPYSLVGGREDNVAILAFQGHIPRA